jgi:hypothetical protein
MRFALVDCTQFVNLCYEDELYTHAFCYSLTLYAS